MREIGSVLTVAPEALTHYLIYKHSSLVLLSMYTFKMAAHSQIQQKMDIMLRKLGLGSTNRELNLSTTQWNEMGAWLSPLLASIKGKRKCREVTLRA